MPEHEERECKKHGTTKHRLDAGTHWRCLICQKERLVEYRRKVKKQLIEHFGGCCVRCGYDKCFAALEFHHRDPAEKLFGVAARGATYAYARILAEAEKCDLLCANCHREVEDQIRIGAIGSATRC